MKWQLGLVDAEDLGRGVSDPLFEGTGEMGLVEIANLVYGVQDGFALPQEVGGALGALDLMNEILGQAGGARETMPHGAGGYFGGMTLQDGVDDRVTREDVVAHETVYKGVGIFEIGKLPDGTVEPKGLARRGGQKGLLIQERCDRQVRHECAGLEFDPKNLGACGVGHDARRR